MGGKRGWSGGAISSDNKKGSFLSLFYVWAHDEKYYSLKRDCGQENSSLFMNNIL